VVGYSLGSFQPTFKLPDRTKHLHEACEMDGRGDALEPAFQTLFPEPLVDWGARITS